MSKVYGIFYTSTGHALVGYGGARGNPLVDRLGPHFPGGTIDGFKKSQDVPNKNIFNSLAKEIEEEFGKIAFDELKGALMKTTSENIWSFQEWGHRVYIAFIKIDEYTGMYVDGPITDGISTQYDQCFLEIRYEHISHILENLSSDNDWFKRGIEELGRRHFNGST